jgi:hypothetical protein
MHLISHKQQTKQIKTHKQTSKNKTHKLQSVRQIPAGATPIQLIQLQSNRSGDESLLCSSCKASYSSRKSKRKNTKEFTLPVKKDIVI